MKRSLVALLLLLAAPPIAVRAQHLKAHASSAAVSPFDRVSDSALSTMQAKATELNISGVALVAYFEGDTLTAWSSKVLVVGSYKQEPGGDKKSSNLLAIVYAKAAEMADTHQKSGSKSRPVMIGETGWEGGVIARTKNGYAIAAFSGGKSEDDVQIAQAGLDRLSAAL